MSRRILEDAREALLVRRLQQDAALSRLQAQQQAVRAARERADRSVERHLASEAAWAAALHDVVDPGVIQLWRAHTADRLEDVRAAERDWADETDLTSHLGAVWGRQVRLAEAVQDVVQAAARKVRRTEEERRLGAAEDARLARRVGP